METRAESPVAAARQSRCKRRGKKRERERGKTGKEAAGRWNFGVEGECGFHIYMYVLSIFVCVCLFWRVCQPTPLQPALACAIAATTTVVVVVVAAAAALAAASPVASIAIVVLPDNRCLRDLEVVCS